MGYTQVSTLSRSNYRATIDDPKVFTRPWTLAFAIGRNRDKNYQFIEVACFEGY